MSLEALFRWLFVVQDRHHSLTCLSFLRRPEETSGDKEEEEERAAKRQAFLTLAGHVLWLLEQMQAANSAPDRLRSLLSEEGVSPIYLCLRQAHSSGDTGVSDLLARCLGVHAKIGNCALHAIVEPLLHDEQPGVLLLGLQLVWEANAQRQYLARLEELFWDAPLKVRRAAIDLIRRAGGVPALTKELLKSCVGEPGFMESQDPEILVSVIDMFTELKKVDEQLFCVVRNAVQGSHAEVIDKCTQLVQFIFQESSRNNNKEAIKLVHHVLEHLHKGRPAEKDSLLARCMDTVLSHGYENQGQVATLPDLLQAQLESHRRQKMEFRRLKTSRLRCLIECLQHSEPIERLMTETVRNLLQEDLPWQQREKGIMALYSWKERVAIKNKYSAIYISHHYGDTMCTHMLEGKLPFVISSLRDRAAPVREASCHVLAVCHGRVQAQQSRTEKLALVETEFAIEADKLMQTSAKVDGVQLELQRGCLSLLYTLLTRKEGSNICSVIAPGKLLAYTTALLLWPVQDEEEQEATHKTASKLLRHFLSKYPGELTKKLPVILPAVLSSWLHLSKWGPFRKLLSKVAHGLDRELTQQWISQELYDELI